LSEFKFINIENFLNFYKNESQNNKNEPQSNTLNNTGIAYKNRLIKFEKFLKYKGGLANNNYKDEVYEFTPNFLKRLKTEFNGSGDIDFYNFMDKYYNFLSLKKLFPKLNDVKSKRAHLYTVVKLLKRNKISIPEGMLDENLESKDPIIEPDSKEGLDKAMIIKILNTTNNDRFKLYVTFLAGSGWRAEEPLYLTWKDFWYVFDDHPNPQYRAKDNKQPKVFLKGEYTKTHTDRNRYITYEVADMLRLWRKKRYGDKRTTVKVGEGKRKHKTTNPIKFSWDHQVFSAKTNSEIKSNYLDFWYKFNSIRNDLQLDYLDAKGKRKEINLKSLREYGRTAAYNVTFDKEFAEYHFGHKTNYKNKGKELELEQFKQCELKAFTFLDASIMKDLVKEESKNMIEVEAKLRKELSQSNQILAKLAYNDWLRDYKDKIFNKIKREVQRDLDRKSNPNDYYIGDREITIDIEEQSSEFQKWFKENYGKDLDGDKIAKINIKEVVLQVDTLRELDANPKYIELEKNKVGTQEGFMEFFKKFIEANPQFKERMIS
jgi:integrase